MERMDMIVETPHELFVVLLNDVRQGTERTTQTVREFSTVAQRTDVKKAREARVFVSRQVVQKLDECFKLIGEQPVELDGHLGKTLIQDFRKELAEVMSPIAKELYVLAKAG